MINEVLNKIKKSGVKFDEITNYLALLYISYLLEKKGLKYDEVDENKIIDIVADSVFNVNILKEYFKYGIVDLVKYFEEKDKKVLVNDFINKTIKKNKRFSKVLDEYIQSGKHTLVILKSNINYLSSYYTGSVTYCFYQEEFIDIYVDRFKMLDELREVERDYVIDFRGLDFSKFDRIVIDDQHIYSKDDPVFMDIIFSFYYYNYFNYKGDILVKTTYRNIAEIKDLKFLSWYVKSIFIDDITNVAASAYILSTPKGNKPNDEEVAIMMLNQELLKKPKDIFTIINDNKEVDDVLIKVGINHIQNNNRRIGFNMYNKKQEKKLKTINDLIDENNSIIDEVDRINSRINYIVSDLFVK